MERHTEYKKQITIRDFMNGFMDSPTDVPIILSDGHAAQNTQMYNLLAAGLLKKI